MIPAVFPGQRHLWPENLNLNLRHKERPKRNNARGSHGAVLRTVRCATHIRDDATGPAPFDRYGNK